MIFEEVKLYNFGIYQGHHTISLDSPNYQKPVILIGALNGAGKTTFLDALQLALYGKFAKCSNRGRLGYLAFLEKNINSFSVDKEASISLRFRHGDDKKKPQVYEIKRSWKKEPSKECKEEIAVTFNGKHDQLLSDQWDDFVNEFIPQSISELFFFDGEKIENLADPKRSAELLKSGIEALLGLEMLTKLSSDLNILKRKKLECQINKNDEKELDYFKIKISESKNQKIKLEKELGLITEKESEELEIFNKILAEISASGADRISIKEVYELQKKEIIQRQFEVNHELQRLVSGSLPLTLVNQLVNETQKQLIIEEDASIFKSSKKLLDTQKNVFFKILESEFGDIEFLNEIKIKLDNNTFVEEEKYKVECYLNGNVSSFIGLDERLAEEEKRSLELIKLKSELNEEMLLIQRKMDTIPSLDSVKDLIAKSAVIESDLFKTRRIKNDISERIEEKTSQIIKMENEYNSILIKNNAIHFEQKRQYQIVNHIDTLNRIILKFNEQLVQENISKLERNIKSKFDQLKRKNSLINKIKINPNDFSITLFRDNTDVISPDRLSAGERQLFAIAILWGLADSSGKELPTIIDTPMGRLDGEHRTKLIEQYFPLAASQVILLSTDEEIYGNYYENLKPYIAQEYNIIYDEKINSSYFAKGYLEVAK